MLSGINNAMCCPARKKKIVRVRYKQLTKIGNYVDNLLSFIEILRVRGG